MKNIRGILPGIFTMGNLACGFGAIVIAGGARYMEFPAQFDVLQEAARLITLAAFFDLLDGFVARISKSSSEFGVQLDSIADIVSFGIAPAVLIINFSLASQDIWSWILAFVFVMAAAFRLARFNLSATLETKSNFIGLSVPVAALSIVSFIPFISEIQEIFDFDEGSFQPEKFFIILIVATSLLMVSAMEYEAMPKFDFSKPKNRAKMLFMLVAGVGFMINFSLVLFPLVMFYIIYGLLQFVISMFSKAQQERKNGNGDNSDEE